MGLFSGITDGLFDLGNTVLNGYYNRKAASKQYQYQVDLWNMNNAYNDPSAQMERLRKAGLNPNLVYGNGSATHTATMASAPNVQSNRANFNFRDYLAAYREGELMKNQVKVSESEAKKAEAEAGIAQKDNAIYGSTGVNPRTGTTGVATALANKIVSAYNGLESYVSDGLQLVGEVGRRSWKGFSDWLNGLKGSEKKVRRDKKGNVVLF